MSKKLMHFKSASVYDTLKHSCDVNAKNGSVSMFDHNSSMQTQI